MRAVRTPYAQTEFLVAVMEDDSTTVKQLLECMTPMQRYELEQCANRCARLLFLKRQTEK